MPDSSGRIVETKGLAEVSKRTGYTKLDRSIRFTFLRLFLSNVTLVMSRSSGAVFNPNTAMRIFATVASWFQIASAEPRK